MATFNVMSKFTAKDAFSNTISKMSQSTAKFKNKASSAFSVINRKMNGLDKASSKLLGGFKQLAGGLAIGSILMIASQGIVAYDKNLHSLQAITGVTGEQFGAFKKNIDSTAKSLKVSGADVANAFSLVGSAKAELLGNADALAEVSKQAIILSKAGGMPIEDAANSLTNAMNQFGVGADKAAKFVDILSTSQQKGTARIGQLSESMIKAGGTAKAFGISFDQTNALLQGFAKGGVTGAEAGTQLTGVLSKLAKVQNKEFNPQFTNGVDIINNLKKANLSYTQLTKLTDSEGAKWLTTLINQNDTVQKLSGNLNEHNNGLAQAAINDASLSARMEQLKAAFVNNITATDNATTGISFMSKGVTFLTDNIDSVMTATTLFIGGLVAYKAIIAISAAATVAQSIFLGVQSAALGFNSAAIGTNSVAKVANTVATTAITVATGVATAAQWAWNTAMSANPIGLVIAAVVALVAGVYLLYKNWDTVSAAVVSFGKTAWGVIRKIGSFIFDMLVAPTKLVIDGIAKITGANWAIKASKGIEKFSMAIAGEESQQQRVSPQMSRPSPLISNTVTSQQVTTERYENITRQQATININDKSGMASVDEEKTDMPLVFNTAGY